MIDKSISIKYQANIQKVFELLTKDVDFLNTKTCALYTLGQPKYIKLFKEKYPWINFTIIETRELNCLYCDLSYKVIYVNIKEGEYWPKDMKFDKIIMNPPYDKNLHLKILKEALCHCEKLISIQPCSWITDKFYSIEKNKDKVYSRKNLSRKIEKLEIFSAEEFNKIFNTNNFFGIGLFIFNNSIDKEYPKSVLSNTDKVFLKIITKNMEIPPFRSQFTNKISDFYLPIRRTSHGYLPWYAEDPTSTSEGIIFSNKVQIENFKKSLNCWIYKLLDNYEWVGKENSAKMPFMGKEINPRTGLSGYESDWTNEDFYNFFNITEKERGLIEKKLNNI